MMTLRRAFLNIVRMPVRSLLFSTVAFIMIFIICFCANTASVSDRAIQVLDATYPFVATVTARKIPSSDGSVDTSVFLNLDVLADLQTSAAVSAYNMNLYAGTLAEDEILTELPDDSVLTKEPLADLHMQNAPVYAVNELFLEQPFMDGSYRIIQGAPFTLADIYGGNRAIIISETIADQYNLKPGDTVNYKVQNTRCYCSCVIRGIYRANSGQPVTTAFITLSDYFSTSAIVKQGGSRADSNSYMERSLDTVNRIDFLLESEKSVSMFLNDAQNHGFDFSRYEITVNDRAYHTAFSGISAIKTISVFVLVLTTTAGCIILGTIIAFYRRARAKETSILFNLGMRYREINLMYFFEYAMMILAAGILAVTLGSMTGNMVVQKLDETYIAELEEYANQQDPVSNAILSFRSSVLSYPVRMNFGRENNTERLPFSIWQSYMTEGGSAVRYEQFYDGKNQKQIWLHGIKNENISSDHGGEILYEPNRMSGIEFPCYIPQGTEYLVGDCFPIYRISGEYFSMMLGNVPQKCAYMTPPMAYVVLRAVGTSESDYIEVDFDDLTMICTYLGISSDIYRNIRYDTNCCFLQIGEN